MTLRELRYLVALADFRHFGRAADCCHVTQPTLSAQLRKLEAYLGQTLIDRNARQPTLTPVGEQIVDRARRLLAEADDILRLTRQHREPLEGVLNIGIIPTLAPYFLPELLRKLRARYTKLQLIVQEDFTANLVAKLKDQLLDAALLALPTPVAHLGYVERPLFDEPFWLVCPSGHPVEQHETIDTDTLAELKMLLLTDGHCMKGQALAICRSGDASFDTGSDEADFRATSLETLRQLVGAGLGCTLLPALAVSQLPPDQLVVRPLRKGESRRIGLVWPAAHRRRDELSLMADALAEAVPEGTWPVRAAA